MSKMYEILKFVDKQGRLSSAEIAKHFKLATSTVERYLRNKEVAKKVDKEKTSEGIVYTSKTYFSRKSVREADVVEALSHVNKAITLEAFAKLNKLPPESIIETVIDSTNLHLLIPLTRRNPWIVRLTHIESATLVFKNSVFRLEKQNQWIELETEKVEQIKWETI